MDRFGEMFEKYGQMQNPPKKLKTLFENHKEVIDHATEVAVDFDNVLVQLGMKLDNDDDIPKEVRKTVKDKIYEIQDLLCELFLWDTALLQME